MLVHVEAIAAAAAAASPLKTQTPSHFCRKDVLEVAQIMGVVVEPSKPGRPLITPNK